jgi:hypothetical protein
MLLDAAAEMFEDALGSLKRACTAVPLTRALLATDHHASHPNDVLSSRRQQASGVPDNAMDDIRMQWQDGMPSCMFALVYRMQLRLLVLSCILIGWLQELIASDCNGLLGAVAYVLSDSTTAIESAAEQHCLPNSAIPRAVLQIAVLQLEERCAWLLTMAIDILGCLREPALRSDIDASKLLKTLSQLIPRQVMPVATYVQPWHVVQLV